ncbi:MAG: hypothetical protein L0H36_01820 [bacterium]|nr:hypothetical protein [bacterium]MDN5835351.1 hypothetical protein [bacterium]
MFAPVMNFWHEETPLHVVKISRDARDEFNVHSHEIHTQFKCDYMWELNFPDKAHEAWIGSMCKSWDQELDHMFFGFGYHASRICFRCDDHIQQEVDRRNQELFSVDNVRVDPYSIQDQQLLESDGYGSRWFAEDYMSEDF